MWNYYIKNDKYEGYNIGLKPSVFANYYEYKTMPNTMDMFLGKVIYDSEALKKVCTEYLHNLELAFESANLYQKEYDAFVNTHINSFLETIALFVKDSAFSHENEFRYVLRIPNDFILDNYSSIKNTGYTIKSGLFRPYIDIEINNEGITEIGLSPLFNESITTTGLELFLNSNEYFSVSIFPSRLKIRF